MWGPRLVEQADRVGAAADAGEQHVRLAAERRLALPPHLLANDRLEVAHLRARPNPDRLQPRAKTLIAQRTGACERARAIMGYGCGPAAEPRM